jgi:uncharacterized iron-regulated membrane protein
MDDVIQNLNIIFLITFIVCLIIVVAGIYLYWLPAKDAGVELTNEQKFKRRLVKIAGVGGTIAFLLIFFITVGVMIWGVLR